MPRRLELIVPVDAARRRVVRDHLMRRDSLLVLFRNAKGLERHMLCRYEGARSRRANLLTVFDVVKQSTRTVNLDTTVRIIDPKTDTVLFEQGGP